MRRLIQLAGACVITASLLAACSPQSGDEEGGKTAEINEEAREGHGSGDDGWRRDIGGNLILATTTSTYDSGLLDAILPQFEEGTGVNVRVIAVGTGAALEMGERGEADALLTHAPLLEEALEEAGDVINRQPVMHNDYVLLGPVTDPADIAGQSIGDAFRVIYEGNHLFFTRGDNSGTHLQELSVWEEAGLSPGYEGYRDTGQGMAETLRISAELDGYVLSDRGTYLSLQNELDPLTVLVEGDGALRNDYHVMQVSPERSAQVHAEAAEAAEALVAYFLDRDTQERIAAFGTDRFGEPLFNGYDEHDGE